MKPPFYELRELNLASGSGTLYNPVVIRRASGNGIPFHRSLSSALVGIAWIFAFPRGGYGQEEAQLAESKNTKQHSLIKSSEPRGGLDRPIPPDPALVLVHELAGRPVVQLSLDERYLQALTFLLPDLDSPQPKARMEARQLFEAICLRSSRPNAEEARLSCSRAVVSLIPQADPVVRTWLVGQLEHIGGEEVIPSLSAAINEPNNSSLNGAGLRGLRAIGGGSAVEALAKALGVESIDPRIRIGILDALGRIGSPTDLPTLTDYLSSPDDRTRLVAVGAVGRIGGENALAALEPYLAIEPNEESETVLIDLPVARAIVDLGHGFLESGAVEPARRAFGLVHDHPSATPEVRAWALPGMIAANTDHALATLRSALESGDVERARSAVVATGRLEEGSGMVALMREFATRSEPSVAIEIVRAFGDREISEALPETRKLVSHESSEVVAEAVRTLSKIGGKDDGELLLGLASSQDELVRRRARQALIDLKGGPMDQVIVGSAMDTKAELPIRIEAIRAVGARGLSDQFESLVLLLGTGGEEMDAVLVDALSTLGSDSNIAVLTDCVLDSKAPSFQPAVAVLRKLCGKTTAPDTVAATLIEALESADEGGDLVIIDLLAVSGGALALSHVTAELESESSSMRRRSVGALANWKGFAGVPKLLELLKAESTTEAERTLIVAGIARLARDSGAAEPSDRLELVLETVNATSSDDDLKQLAPALGGLPSVQTADALTVMMKNRPGAAKEAAAAAIDVAESLKGHPGKRAALLQNALLVPGVPDQLRDKAQRLAAAGRDDAPVPPVESAP